MRSVRLPAPNPPVCFRADQDRQPDAGVVLVGSRCSLPVLFALCWRSDGSRGAAQDHPRRHGRLLRVGSARSSGTIRTCAAGRWPSVPPPSAAYRWPLPAMRRCQFGVQVGAALGHGGQRRCPELVFVKPRFRSSIGRCLGRSHGIFAAYTSLIQPLSCLMRRISMSPRTGVAFRRRG